jgi:hypothetical protein
MLSLASPISRINLGLPVSASDITYPPANLTDDNYANQVASSAVTPGAPYWFAWDLSSLSGSVRRSVVLLLDNESGNFLLNASTVGYPTAYTIQTSTSAGGGSAPADGDVSWVTLVTVSSEIKPRRRHLLGDLSGVNWLRVRITAVTNTSTANELHLAALDLFDGRRGYSNCWLIIGDSTTQEGGGLADATTGAEWTGGPIARQVNALCPQHWPIIISAGNGGMDMQYAHDNMSSLLSSFGNGYVVMQMGLNDANSTTDLSGAPATVATWYSNLLFCIDQIVANGSIPVLGKIQWATANTTTAGNGLILNNKIEQALTTDRPDCLRGPDMYSAFNGQTALLRADHLHPSYGVGGGYELWIRTMAQAISRYMLTDYTRTHGSGVVAHTR